MPSTPSTTFDLSNLAVLLDRRRGAPPVTRQLLSHMRAAIEDGRLTSSSRLPSSRSLAADLALSRTVVTEVYGMLQSEGYVESRRGSGTYVVECSRRLRGTATGALGGASPGRRASCPETPADAETPRRPRWLRSVVDPPAVDPFEAKGLASFRICEPEPTSFPDTAWRTCARAAIAEDLPDGYGATAGDAGLRRAIAAWVTRHRGLRCTADDVVVTSGTTQSLDLIARATLRPGDEVAFEDPGYRLARQIFTDHGAEVRPLSVDEEGLCCAELVNAPPPRLVYTTPSHQFPVGSVLSFRRRGQLLDWAARHDVLVIEDDYDSEFRFDGPALPPLASQTTESVAYLGTFSKALAPSLRLGYLVAPTPLLQAVRRLKTRVDHHSCWPVQRALARYLESGAFDRHVRRMGRLYRQRRDRLVEATEPLPEGARWVGLAAGLHATLRLPKGCDVEAVVDRCRRLGVEVRSLRHYAMAAIAFEGLVLGYGACDGRQLAAMGKVVRLAMG